MFHIEIRTGMQAVRRFNLDDRRLWSGFLEPLMAGRELSIEGHEFVPRDTRLTIYEGPELRPDQLGMGRGWQNVERSCAEVTERVLRAAREHHAADRAAATPQPAPPSAEPPAELLLERLIGRLHAGAIDGAEITALAAELLPGGDQAQIAALAGGAVWELLARGGLQLCRSER